MAGLSLACECEILPIWQNEGLTLIERCFEDWYDLQPKTESYEEQKILQNAIDFLQTKSLFFIDAINATLVTSYEHPGFIQREKAQTIFIMSIQKSLSKKSVRDTTKTKSLKYCIKQAG
ncbi:hypothetical protein [Suttonella ornithocola]|uniref:hypothetical protein n=1 Tax=Suttonella ornithocola TaxID=279832 RepID=UPI0009348A81|nr:hypothetical protein [Suttonella ornithocola]